MTCKHWYKQMCLNKEKLIFLDHEMNVDFVDLAVI